MRCDAAKEHGLQRVRKRMRGWREKERAQERRDRPAPQRDPITAEWLEWCWVGLRCAGDLIVFFGPTEARGMDVGKTLGACVCAQSPGRQGRARRARDVCFLTTTTIRAAPALFAASAHPSIQKAGWQAGSFF